MLIELYHGTCRLPTPSDIYSGYIILPERKVQVQRCGNDVTKLTIAPYGDFIDENYQRLGFFRIDMLPKGELDKNPRFKKRFLKLNLERVELDYEKVRDLYFNFWQKRIEVYVPDYERLFCPIIAAAQFFDPLHINKLDTLFALYLPEHIEIIRRIIKELHNEKFA